MGVCSLNTLLGTRAAGAAVKVVVPLLVCALALLAVASAKPNPGEEERAKKPGGKPGKPSNNGGGGKPGKPDKPGMAGKGLCLNRDEVSMLCMYNTDFGLKFWELPGLAWRTMKRRREESA